jgi:surface polysaccharide O-acyltransferase-like enzyme
MAKEYLKSIVKSSVNFHLWYIYMIIGIYLFIPIIGKWARNSSDKNLLYFLSIWFCAQIFDLPIIDKYRTYIDLTDFSGYVGYLVLGYYLSSRFTKYSLLGAMGLMLLGYVLTVGATYYATKVRGAFVHTYYDYLRPNIVLLSAGVFLAVKKLDTKKVNNNIVRKGIHLISEYSFGIYLSHWLMVILLREAGIYWDSLHPLAGIPVTVLLGLVMAISVTWLIRKLPFGKYVSG